MLPFSEAGLDKTSLHVNFGKVSTLNMEEDPPW